METKTLSLSFFQGSKRNISVDDWAMDCTTLAPVECDDTTHFRCRVTGACELKDTLCDMERNCCDGTDEEVEQCDGYTQYNFDDWLWKGALTSTDIQFPPH